MPDRRDTWSWRAWLRSTVNSWTPRRLHVYRGLCAGITMDRLVRMMVGMCAWRRWKRTMFDGKWCGRRT